MAVGGEDFPLICRRRWVGLNGRNQYCIFRSQLCSALALVSAHYNTPYSLSHFLLNKLGLQLLAEPVEVEMLTSVPNYVVVFRAIIAIYGRAYR